MHVLHPDPVALLDVHPRIDGDRPLPGYPETAKDPRLLPALDDVVVLRREEEEGLSARRGGPGLLEDAADRADVAVLIDGPGHGHALVERKVLHHREEERGHQRSCTGAVDLGDPVGALDAEDDVAPRKVRVGTAGGEVDGTVCGILKDDPHQGRRLDEHPPSPGHDLDRYVHHRPLLDHPVRGERADAGDLDLLEGDGCLHRCRSPDPGERGHGRRRGRTGIRREQRGDIVPGHESDGKEEDVRKERKNEEDRQGLLPYAHMLPAYRSSRYILFPWRICTRTCPPIHR